MAHDRWARVKLLSLTLDRNQPEPIRLTMEKSENLVDDHFVFIERYNDEWTGDDRSPPPPNDTRTTTTRIIDHRDLMAGLRDCFYRTANAALDLCDADRVQGIVRYRNEDYVIFPLPERFGKRNMHIITPSSKSRFRLAQHVDDELPAVQKRNRRAILGTAPPTATGEAQNVTKPHVLHVETAIFVDKDLFRHMAKNYPKNTEMHLIRFVLAMVNGVQLLYHHPSLGREINFVLKRLEILHKDPKDLRRSSDIDVFLNSFCMWQRKFNPFSDQDAMHFDHAVILTG